MNNGTDIAAIRNQLQQIVFKKASHEVLNPYSQAVFGKLRDCHTAQNGVNYFRCNEGNCLHEHYQFHNCGNRHCPNCGGLRREQWLEDKTAELLPTSYYHVVFTLPHELNSLIMGNRKEMFKLLFDAGAYTLLKLAKDEKWLGATPGIISILHTWGQDLSFHPHVHCIVSGGGINNGNWIKEKRKNNTYLFPKDAMRKIYKAYFLRQLRKMLAKKILQVKDDAAIENMIREIGFKKWNVYAKKPFGGPLQVLEYLGRYTHKVAITAHRIQEIDKAKNSLTFRYKDYHARGTNDEKKVMTITIDEFIRRFEQHILPLRFVKIRHYGYLSNHHRTKRLQQLFDLMKLPPPPQKVQVPVQTRMLEKHGVDITMCPGCKKGKLELVATFRRGVLCKTFADTKSEPAICNKASP